MVIGIILTIYQSSIIWSLLKEGHVNTNKVKLIESILFAFFYLY